VGVGEYRLAGLRCLLGLFAFGAVGWIRVGTWHGTGFASGDEPGFAGLASC